MSIPIEEYNSIKKELDDIKKKNDDLETKLKSYTNNNRHKKYYENNADAIKEKSKNYMEKIKETDPKKLKEWRHTAYLKRKEKLKIDIKDAT